MHVRETDDPTALLHQLTCGALARGEPLRDLSVTRPSLEDVYLELTAEAEEERRPCLRPRLAWRQYRLERRMFWRNPSAAFFNFALPLIFLALFGAIFSGDQEDLDVIVPGIAGMSIVSTTFIALAINIVSLREQGILKRLRGTPLPSGAYLSAVAMHAITNTVVQVALVTVVGRVFFGTGWPKDVPELVVFVAARRRVLRVARASRSPRRSRTSTPRPPTSNAVFLPLIVLTGVFYDAEDARRSCTTSPTRCR